MAKNKNKNRPQGNPQRNNPPVQVKQVTPVTVEDVKNSTSQAEFDKLKNKLLEQLLTEVETFEKEKKVADAAATAAKEALAKITQEREELESERD